MKITEILKNNRVTISCELFPPKEGGKLGEYQNIAAEVAKLRPSFISVTYGAGGSTAKYTAEIADAVQNQSGVTALAHLTCVASDRQEIQNTLSKLRSRGISNILALRGDMPQDGAFGSFSHANELAEEIRAFGGFCIGGACYPEGHPESQNLKADIDAIKRKVDCGCEFLTTQMFFDNHILYNYLYKLLSEEIRVPVVAGIMPVINGKQIKRICDISGTALPARFKQIVDRFGDKPGAMRQAGIAYATDQIIDLIANGVNHIHIYTMNKPDIAAEIMHNLSEIYPS